MSEVLDTLLSLVARGNATLAEISRLKDVIPPEYRCDVSKDHGGRTVATVMQGWTRRRGESSL